MTGAGGFLGRHVVAALRSRGVEARALLRPGESTDGLGWPASMELLRADLGTAGDLAAAFEGVEVLVHLAASLSGDREQQRTNTVRGTARLLAAMARSTCTRLVLASSFAVYDWSAIRGDLDEGSPLERAPDLYARDGYAIGKSWQERITRCMARRYGWDLTVLRPGFLWGRGTDHLAALGPRVGKLHLAVGPLSRRPLTHVENCADLFALAAIDARARGQTFNVVDGRGERYWDFLGACLRRSGKGGIRVPIPYSLAYGLVRLASAVLTRRRRALPNLLVPSRFEARLKPLRFESRRARELLGWSPPLGLAECLERTYPRPLAR